MERFDLLTWNSTWENRKIPDYSQQKWGFAGELQNSSKLDSGKGKNISRSKWKKKKTDRLVDHKINVILEGKVLCNLPYSPTGGSLYHTKNTWYLPPLRPSNVLNPTFNIFHKVSFVEKPLNTWTFRPHLLLRLSIFHWCPFSFKCCSPVVKSLPSESFNDQDYTYRP